MEVLRLTKKQVENVYEKYLTEDFASNERKPLAAILKGVEQGTYECLGFFQERQLTGYAFLVETEKDYLLDYLAVIREKRNQGTGTLILTELAGYCREKDSLICEVENPAYAGNEEEHRLRERRKAFYMRSGFVDTGVDVRTFGVEYRLLERPLGKTHTEDEIKELYKKHYRAYLPAILYKTMIKVR